MNEKMIAGEKAVEYVKNGMTVGLGTGSTVYYTIAKIAEMVEAGLEIKAVSTSSSTTKLAKSLGIDVVSMNEVDIIDLTIDGADEIDENLNGIKGGGGALFYEKMVAEFSEKVIWVADSSKKVKKLGRFYLPVEVSPFAYKQIMKKLLMSGANPHIRKKEDGYYRTDSGNYIIDLDMKEINDSREFEKWLNMIPGVIENGLFNDIADIVIYGKQNGFEIIEK